MEEIQVTKRNGQKESFDVTKINKVIEWAIEGLSGVSLSDLVVHAKLKFYDGITTKDIHKTIIRSASELISLDTPNYQYVAARLLSFNLRKEVWGSEDEPDFYDFIKKNVDEGIYDPILLDKYTKQEINDFGDALDHDRDNRFTFAGFQQLCDKYLIKDRSTDKIFETPQIAFMALCMTVFQKYPKESRFQYVLKAYNYISNFKINLPTPIMAGVRTLKRQFASCTLIDVGDTMNSISNAVTATMKYTASRAGIGLNMGSMRPINSPIRKGEVVHTGVIPFLKVFESAVRSCSQNGIRGGNGTVNFPWWHYEIEDIVVLKNNMGTDDNRVRKLDYCVGMSKLFYQRFQKNELITLFSPQEAKGLYEAFGTEKFDELYIKCEQDPNLKFKRTIRAQVLMKLIATERVETGRIYLLNVDHCNTHGPFKDTVRMTNLCVEVTHPTSPMKHIEDPEAEIGICLLSALNVLEIKSDAEMEKVCDIIVRILEEIIDIQEYPIKAAENFTKKRRSLAVGVTNLAAWLAKQNLKYSSSQAPNAVDELQEKIQFYLLKASCSLAKERGPCEKFNLTKYSDGILPLDTYNKNVDKFVTRKPSMDWESLREEIRTYGLRHSTMSAQMPCESSSVIQNSTNGFEGIRALLKTVKSKANVLKQLVPHAVHYGKRYEQVFDFQDNIGYINICAAAQKWIDMSMSTYFYYNYNHYPDKQLPISKVIKEILYSYSVGLKGLYYLLTDDGDRQEAEAEGCASGACAV